MIPAQRACFRNVHPPATSSNAGLELDRYLPAAVGGDNAPLHDLIDRVCAATPPAIYGAAYRRWEAMLIAGGNAVAHGVFAVSDRLIVGLGGGSVRETGVTLHHLYGVPLIPGSALKGLSRRYSRAALEAAAADPDDPTTDDLATAQLEALVGSTRAAAHLTFFDAWYVPKSAPGDRPLQPDVITVHHPVYYGSRGARGYGPWDFDDPTPIPFLREAGSYLVAVRGPDAAWAEFGLATLERALTEWGIGAKTSSGYGRLRKEDPGQAAAAALATDIAALTAPTAAELRALYERWRTLGAEQRPALAKALMVHMTAEGLHNQIDFNVGWGRSIRISAHEG